MSYASTDYMKYVFCANRKNCAKKNSCPYRSRKLSINGEYYLHFHCEHGRFPTAVFSVFIFILAALLFVGFILQKKIADVSAAVTPPLMTAENLELLSLHDAVAGGVAKESSRSNRQLSSPETVKIPDTENLAYEKQNEEKVAAAENFSAEKQSDKLAIVEKNYREVTLEVTGYTLSFESCGKYPDDPDYGITASGTYVKPHHTISAPRSMGFGTNLRIPAYEDFWGLSETPLTVEDRGGAIKEGKLDIYFENEEDAFKWGRRNVTVYIYE